MKHRLGCRGSDDKPAILPKTKRSGIMVSDFIDEHNGYLRLSSEELEDARSTDPNFPKEARELFEYGAARAGYWTGEKFMRQIEKASKIAELKYPPAMHSLVWLFDQSSCHRAYAPDSLNVNNMNVRPGGAQAVMRDTVWAGKIQKMVDANGIPKGMKQVLEERGINTATLLGPDMRIILANNDDFKSEKTIVETYFISRRQAVHFIPKFHCEMNPIERVWGQAKRYTRMYTNFTLPGLLNIIEPGLIP